MDASAAVRTYVDFVPPHSLLEEPDKVALRVDLSAEGFKKEQLKVQIDNYGRLRISGERPVGAGGKHWRRFRKQFDVSEVCNAGAIRARLEKDGVLRITMPRLTTAAATEDTTAANTGGAAGQDQKGRTAAEQAGAPAADAEAEEEDGHEDAGATSMERPGAAAAAAAARPAYGFAKKRRGMVWTILALVLALVGAGLYARYRVMDMDTSSEAAPASNQIIALSADS
ncbi:hypothetical protein ACP70R_017085 [Stipagrostis hirtigluma subsp. patula]